MISQSSPPQVVIVGSGVIGIACAHYLSQAGCGVTVIDRGGIAGACSHANCGYICPSHVLPLTEPSAIPLALRSLANPHAPFRVKPSLKPAVWNWMFQFARRCNQRQMLMAGKSLQAILDSSMLEYRRLMEQEPLQCEWKQTGLLYVLQTQSGLADFAESHRLIEEHFGVHADQLSPGELTDLEPALRTGLAGGFHYPGDASVRPDKLNAQWTARLQSRGVRFIENCELQKIDRSDGRITQLLTTHGPLTGDQFVFAIGAWSPQIADQLDCPVPIQPGKGYSLTMQRPAQCPRLPMLFPEHKVGVSPFDDGYRLGSMMEFVGYDTSIPQRRIEQLRKSAEPYLITPHSDGDCQRWYGWRPMTWDSLPIIGPTAKLANALMATGHNMLGLSMAPATGKLIAEMICGQPTHIDASAYSPHRF